MSNPFQTTDEDASRKYAHAIEHKAKAEALKKAKNKEIDKKWDKYNAEHGKTPTGKRKWHYYNTSIK